MSNKDEYDVKEMLHVTDPIDPLGGRHTFERGGNGEIVVGYCVPIESIDRDSLPPDAIECEMRKRTDGVWEKRTRHGPAMVNSPTYRSNWTNIFGNTQPVGQA